VQTLETSSSVEERRYRGRPAEMSLNGSKFFGMVRSVQQDRSRSLQRWIVTIVPAVEKPPLVGWRYNLKFKEIDAGQPAVSERHDEVGASALLCSGTRMPKTTARRQGSPRIVCPAQNKVPDIPVSIIELCSAVCAQCIGGVRPSIHQGHFVDARRLSAWLP
jgi:hypothetical protein